MLCFLNCPLHFWTEFCFLILYLPLVLLPATELGLDLICIIFFCLFLLSAVLNLWTCRLCVSFSAVYSELCLNPCLALSLFLLSLKVQFEFYMLYLYCVLKGLTREMMKKISCILHFASLSFWQFWSDFAFWYLFQKSFHDSLYASIDFLWVDFVLDGKFGLNFFSLDWILDFELLCSLNFMTYAFAFTFMK